MIVLPLDASHWWSSVLGVTGPLGMPGILLHSCVVYGILHLCKLERIWVSE